MLEMKSSNGFLSVTDSDAVFCDVQNFTFLTVMDLPGNLATLIISPKMDIQTSVKA